MNDRTVEESIFEKLNGVRKYLPPKDGEVIPILFTYEEAKCLYYVLSNIQKPTLFDDETYNSFYNKLENELYNLSSNIVVNLEHDEILFGLYLITDIVAKQQRIRDAHKGIRSTELFNSLMYLNGVIGDYNKHRMAMDIVMEYIECLEEEVQSLHAQEELSD